MHWKEAVCRESRHGAAIQQIDGESCLCRSGSAARIDGSHVRGIPTYGVVVSGVEVVAHLYVTHKMLDEYGTFPA